MFCLIVLILFYAAAIVGPFILSAVGLDPLKLDKAAIGASGGKPKGDFGGISPTHILGVVGGTGR